jgi:integrase/recombinase XerD
MTVLFKSHWAAALRAFLQFKRGLGYRYARSEYTLREFDRFLCREAERHRGERLDQAMLSWLASKPQRKAVSVSMDAAVLRQFCLYLRRRPGHSFFREPLWPRLPTESSFVPYILSAQDIRRLLKLTGQLDRPPFRAALYRALLLLLYCTGLRFGEALRLRLRDVDTRQAILFVETFKGRARWVPFHRSLAKELDKYLAARRAFASAQPDDRFFVGIHKKRLPTNTAWETIRRLFQKAGLKPDRGRIGPRPYDLRHAFAIHRLTRWSRQGVDLLTRLPWLSAYMGHDDILGTETYLTATPELLSLATHRFRRRYLTSPNERSREES